MTNRIMSVALILLTATACASTATPPADTAPDPSAQAAPAPPNGSILPAGTDLRLKVKDELDPARIRRGDTFTATVVEPLVAINGEVAIPDGAVATAMVTGISTVNGRVALRINFLRISVKGVYHPFTADIRDSQAGVIAAGEQRAEIAKELGPGPGAIITLASGTVMPAGSELTVRNRDTIELRQN